MIKLVVVIDEMELGGAQRQLTYLLTHINRQEYSPHLIFFRRPSVLVEQLKAFDVPVTYIEKRSTLDIGFFLKLVKTLKNLEYDILQGFNVTAEVWGLLAHKLISKGLFVGSVRCEISGLTSREQKLKPWITRHSDLVIANSKAGMASLRDRVKFPDSKAKLIYNGIELPTAKRKAIDLPNAQGKLVLCLVGRLVDYKNVSLIFRAMRECSEAIRSQVHVVVVGDGPERVALEALATQDFPSQFTFVGESSAVSDWYSVADVYIQTSNTEGLSNTLMEAMSHELAVVATAVGGTSELVENSDQGLLFEQNNASELAEHISTLKTQPELLRQLGKKARQQIQRHFSLQAMVQQYEAVYCQLIKGKNEQAI